MRSRSTWSAARFAAALAAAAACGAPGPRAPALSPLPTLDDPFLADNQLGLWRTLRTAAAFVGETEATGAPPIAWTGELRFTQRVVTRVVDPICGAAPRGTVELDVTVIEGARPSAPSPGLADWITAPGSRAAYLVVDGRIDGEDLAIVPATPSTVTWLRAACQRPTPPPGIPAVLDTFARRTASSQALLARFRALDPVAVDVLDGDRLAARLVYSGNTLTTFSGVGRDRIVALRPADVTIRATAAQLASAFTGHASLAPLVTAGHAPAFLAALDDTGRALGRDRDATAALHASTP
jgi:hypothetical protein